MSQHQLSAPDANFTDSRRTTSAANDDSSLAGTAYGSNKDLDTRLKAIDAGLYTDAYLDGMTQNDKVYAVRLADDAASLG